MLSATIVVSSLVLWNLFIYDCLGAEHTEKAEAFSVPLQAFARVYKFKKYELDKDTEEKIMYYLPCDFLDEVYDSDLSDVVKTAFNEENYNKNKLDFYKLYFELLKKYPAVVIESLLSSSYGYFYYDNTVNKVITGIAPVGYSYSKDISLSTKPLINGALVKGIVYLVNDSENLFIKVLFSIGVYFSIYLILVVYNIKYKKSKYLIVFLPLLFLWATCIASPVNGELRYIYSLFVTMPLYIAISKM